MYCEELETYAPNNEFNENDRVYKWENWSCRNTSNHINLNVGEGCLIFVSKEEISEMEIVGLYHIVKDKAKMYEGLDIRFEITKGDYNAKQDRIYNYKTRLSVNKISKGCPTEEILEILRYAKHIICVHYTANARYKKSKWWRFRNKKISKVINLAIDDN